MVRGQLTGRRCGQWGVSVSHCQWQRVYGHEADDAVEVTGRQPDARWPVIMTTGGIMTVEQRLNELGTASIGPPVGCSVSDNACILLPDSDTI